MNELDIKLGLVQEVRQQVRLPGSTALSWKYGNLAFWKYGNTLQKPILNDKESAFNLQIIK